MKEYIASADKTLSDCPCSNCIWATSYCVYMHDTPCMLCAFAVWLCTLSCCKHLCLCVRGAGMHVQGGMGCWDVQMCTDLLVCMCICVRISPCVYIHKQWRCGGWMWWWWLLVVEVATSACKQQVETNRYSNKSTFCRPHCFITSITCWWLSHLYK